jgi:acyl-CoA thioesterase
MDIKELLSHDRFAAMAGVELLEVGEKIDDYKTGPGADKTAQRTHKTSQSSSQRTDETTQRTGQTNPKTGQRTAKARMEITPAHLNAAGVCQGGALFTLADLAFAAASNSAGRPTVSIQSDIRIFRAEKEGTLYAEACEVFDHKRLSACEVRITNAAGELVATFSATGYRKEA